MKIKMCTADANSNKAVTNNRIHIVQELFG